MKINLKHDIDIEIATAHSRVAKKWKNKAIKWSSLVSRCSEAQITNETALEYSRMTREEQSNIKDVGGFVGGYLSGGTRKNTNVMYRTVATLDIDFGTPDIWDDFTMAFDFAAMIYSTHKHSAEKPRYRLVIPFNRRVSPAEYEPICRKIAAEIGIDFFDDTTYELPRLFYWPSASKDAPVVFEYQDGPICDVDKVLAQYINPANVSEWPMSSREGDIIVRSIKKAGDPTEKPGLIGAFCRAYSIEEAIETFLPDQYEKTAAEGRYTYKLGTVAGGLVCYEGKFAYSHHDTDPASRQLCNAFDLARIHLFGAHDEGTTVADVTRRPSYLKMQDFVAADKEVRKLLGQERRAEVAADFGGVAVEDDTEDAAEAANDAWMENLEYTKGGKVVSSARNIIYIMENDPALKGHIWHDLFSGFDLVKGGLPWDKKATQWGNRDDANLRVYLEENYGVTGKDKIKDAKDAVLTRHKVHPIRDYLNGLTWDGVPRLDKLIIDYIGADDTLLNRTITRKHFTAAVARIMKPGCKYDYCLIMTGPEGIGKSTLLSIMGGDWFNDSITTTEGKEGMEQLRRAWLIELAELSSIKRSDVEQVKNYITRRDDIYRAAYGQVVEKHPRQCVFCGTTNEEYFLKGSTGNRRFWVISVDGSKRKYNDGYETLAHDRDQLWAEAVYYYKAGEKLYLSAELEAEARDRQAQYNDDSDDPMRDMLADYLGMRLPVDWDTYPLSKRRDYICNRDPLASDGVVLRDRVCAVEFICERMGRSQADKEFKYLARKVSKLMGELSGWERIGSTKHAAKLYGTQRGFRRTYTPDDADE